MIDVQVLRTDPDRVRASQAARGESVELVDQLLAADEARRGAISRFEQLRAEQKDLGRQIPRATGDERAALMARTKELSDLVKKAEGMAGELGTAFAGLLEQVGNLVGAGVPEGGEDDYVVLETHGEPRDFAAE
ncbi:MAG: hypothetical protein ACRYG2_19265, partial [Janthinobacterium lividum]